MTARGVFFSVVMGTAALAAGATEPEARRPNIVVILADDLGFSDLGCYGGEIDTPNLDRLAAGGLRFTQCYNTARCWPTRAALLTGYYAQAIGRDRLPGGTGGAQGTRPGWAKLLPEMLAPAGYRSYHSGKWHIDGHPTRNGFDRSLDVAGAGQSNYFDAAGIKSDGVPVKPESYYATTAIGDHAVDCLKEHAQDHAGKPFFHYVAFTSPHFPLQAPADMIAKYRDRYRAGWDSIRDERVKRLAAKGIVTTDASSIERDLGSPYRFKDIAKKLGTVEVDLPLAWDSLTEEQRDFQATKMAIHAAMVDIMDREIGRIIRQLADMGAIDNTLILFASDNGASAEMMIRGEGHDPGAPPGSRRTFLCLGPGWSSCANAPFRRHKTWVHEGGIATPWIVHWPAGIAAKGELRHQPVHVIDLVPTVLEVARVEPKRAQAAPPMHGKSFAEALRDSKAPAAHDSLWWCHEENRAVRMGDWKLVASKGDPWELYNLASDRCETKNLAAAEPQRVQTLDKEWNRIAEECRRVAPVGEPRRKPAKNASARKPNILFILVDDQLPYDLKAYDPSSRLETPVLDALAARGVVLDAAYHMGSFSGAVCTPSRHMIMTGRSVWHLPIGPGQAKGKRADGGIQIRCPANIEDHVLASVFNKAGYSTMRTCKQGNSYEGANKRFTVRHDATKREGTAEGGSAWHADRVLEFLADREESGDDKPFLIEYGFSHPHDTRDGTPELLEKYGAVNHTDESRPPRLNAKLPPLPANWLPRHPFDNTHVDVRDEVAVSGVWKRRDEATIRNEVGREFACSENIDIQIGRVVAKLRDMGELENTWIFYTADHGIAIGRHGLQGKQNLYEHTWRVPFIVAGPGVKAGSRAPGNVYLTDVLATLCDIAGIDPPKTNEGTSFLAVLTGEVAQVRDVLYGVYCGGAKPGIRSVRKGDWKLIKYESPEGGLVTQVFNLKANPHELLEQHHDPAVLAIANGNPGPKQKNLADDPGHAAKRAEMEALLASEMERHDDPYRFSDQPVVRKKL